MHYGLEARSPFLDHELWTYAATLPYGVRMHKGRLKAILREIARRRIGESVATGSKRGFSIPVLRWMTGKWKATVEETFRTSHLAEQGWIRGESLLAELARAERIGVATNQLWYCYVLETWFREQHLKSEIQTSVA